jgi:hypothetical protein
MGGPSATSAPGLGPRLPHLRRDSPQIIPEFDSCMESLKNEVYSRINSMVDTPANKK